VRAREQSNGMLAGLLRIEPSSLVVPAAIVALAAALRLWAIGLDSPDPFYDAAVRSMGLSWHNFFFGALDPSGRLAIDKPPVDLWLQVASTKLLGFNRTALALPEALGGIAAVALLYAAISRAGGRVAGAIAALVLAVLLGLIIGFLLGVHRFSSEVFEPVLVAFYSVPKITLYPIILLAFGLGLPAKIAFGTIHGVVPVAIFTMGAVRSLNPILLKTARVLRLRPQELVGSVLLPAALPEIFTGIRLGFALTLIGTLLGEMFGSQRGLGYLLMTAIGLQNVQLIMAVTLLIVLFAALVSTLLIVIDHRLHRRVT